MFRCELQLTTKTVELEMQAIIVYAEINLTVYSSSTIQVMVTRFECSGSGSGSGVKCEVEEEEGGVRNCTSHLACK